MKKILTLGVAAVGLALTSTPAAAFSIWDYTPWGSYWS